MTRRVLAASLALALVPALSGCWVFEELDKGEKLIDQYGGGMNENTPSKAQKAVATEEPKKDAVAEYFRKENEAGTTRTISPGQVSEGIVKCRLGGSTQFMTKDACAARGGLEGA